jgi:hypothetical protein
LPGAISLVAAESAGDFNALIQFAPEIIGNDFIISYLTDISFDSSFYPFYNIIQGIVHDKLAPGIPKDLAPVFGKGDFEGLVLPHGRAIVMKSSHPETGKGLAIKKQGAEKKEEAKPNGFGPRHWFHG